MAACMNGISVTAGNAIAHAQQNHALCRRPISSLIHQFSPAEQCAGAVEFRSRLFQLPIRLDQHLLRAERHQSTGSFYRRQPFNASHHGRFRLAAHVPSQRQSADAVEQSTQSYLVHFEKTATSQAWPGFISSAFPRFHDIYAQVGSPDAQAYLDDANGNTLASTLRRAMTNNSALVQIVTWNDFGEGTIVEPTVRRKRTDH